MQPLITYLQALIITIIIFFTPIHGILLLVGLSIMMDTVFGLYTSNKLNLPITSRKMGRVITKMLVYQSTVILFFLIDCFLINDIVMALLTPISYLTTKLMSMVLVSVELYSMDESIRLVNNDKGIIFYIKRLLKLTKAAKSEYDELNKED